MSSPRRVPLARSARTLLAAVVAAAAALLTAAPAAGHAQPRSERPSPSDTTAAREYTILIYESDAQLAARTSPTAGDAYWDAYDRFAGELARAGVLRGGSALDERMKATVRGSGSADRAAAEAWARKAPPLALAVEVRPHRPNPHMAAMVGAHR